MHLAFDPLFLVFALALVMLVCLWRGRACSLRWLVLLTFAYAGLAAVCSPIVSFLMLGSLEWRYPSGDVQSAEAQAIVVLSGDLRPLDARWNRVELGVSTLYRCLFAVKVYRSEKQCPVLVSGGKADVERPGPTLARAMATFLVEHGVAEQDLMIEERSRSTYENAVEAARLLHKRGIDKVLLVTDAIHLWRAERCFQVQGMEVVPCGVYYRATHFNWSLPALLPCTGAAQNTQSALYEWLGLAWYWLRGRI